MLYFLLKFCQSWWLNFFIWNKWRSQPHLQAFLQKYIFNKPKIKHIMSWHHVDQNDLFKISKFAVFFVYASATELHQVDPNTVKPAISPWVSFTRLDTSVCSSNLACADIFVLCFWGYSATFNWMVVFTSGLTPVQSKMGCRCFFQFCTYSITYV